MPEFDTSHVKNIVLLGHAGSGKTTLAECMLYEAGLITRRGTRGIPRNVCLQGVPPVGLPAAIPAHVRIKAEHVRDVGRRRNLLAPGDRA